jgi:transcriptional regulator with XRE-family HTH domain
METPKNNIGDIIREHRNRKGITQEKLAELIGKNQQDINRYENNSSIPGRDIWRTICKKLDIPLSAYFPESAAAKEYVSESKNQTYNDKVLTELIDLIRKEREFVNEIELAKLLKSISKMSTEKRKLIIQIIKTFLI